MDGEPEAFSDTATNCNFVSASEALSDHNQAKLDSLEKKAVHLRLVLEKDFKAADIKWSMFVSAAFSFRYESCLRPFPPVFMKNGIKDMDELLSVVTDVPALDLVLQQLDNLDNLANISDILDLLFYVLVRLKEPSLKTVPPEAHDAILFNSNSLLPAPKPQYIFQVVHSCKSSSEMKWKELSKSHKVFYAYHGNRLENFYTILHFGLQQHLNKAVFTWNYIGMCPTSFTTRVNVFHAAIPPRFKLERKTNERKTKRLRTPNGLKTSPVHPDIILRENIQATIMGNGVYLSSELNMSLPYSHGGFGWGASCIGGHLSCIAMCEVIDAPEGINYHKPVTNEGDGVYEDDKTKVCSDENIDSRTAHYVVTNSDLMRLRYLLVYAKQPASMRFPTASSNRDAGGLRQWLNRHKLVSILLGYGLMLATIGFANNQPINYYYKILLKKLDVALSNVK